MLVSDAVVLPLPIGVEPVPPQGGISFLLLPPHAWGDELSPRITLGLLEHPAPASRSLPCRDADVRMPPCTRVEMASGPQTCPSAPFLQTWGGSLGCLS